LSLNQLNQVPSGFNNNVIWNVAHVLVTQQILIYGLSSLPFVIDNSLVDQFRKGATGNITLSEDEITKVKFALMTAINSSQQDYENAVFKTNKC